MLLGFRIRETRNHRVRLFLIGWVMRDNHHIEEIGVGASWQQGLHTDAEGRYFKADHLAPKTWQPKTWRAGRIKAMMSQKEFLSTRSPLATHCSEYQLLFCVPQRV